MDIRVSPDVRVRGRGRWSVLGVRWRTWWPAGRRRGGGWIRTLVDETTARRELAMAGTARTVGGFRRDLADVVAFPACLLVPPERREAHRRRRPSHPRSAGGTRDFVVA